MSPSLRLTLVCVAAYIAAGIFYVVRGLGQTTSYRNERDWGGLGVVAVCWLPITTGNLLWSVGRQDFTLLERFLSEAALPLALFAVIIISEIGMTWT